MSMQVARLCGLECEKSRAPRRQGARVPWRAAVGSAWSCLLGPAQLLRPSPSSQHCSLGHCSAPWLVVFVHKSLQCLATYSYPKINTLGVLFLLFLYFSSWASPWPTFEGLKGGRGLFCRSWGVGGLLLMMLVLVTWTEVPVIGDNISLVLYKPGAAWEGREHRAAPPIPHPCYGSRKEGRTREEWSILSLNPHFTCEIGSSLPISWKRKT